MAERKQKRESEEPVELDVEEAGFVLQPAKIEIGSGYTLCINYDENEKPIVDVKTYGAVDVSKLRMEIERLFPHAQIRELKNTQSVAVVKKRKRNKKLKWYLENFAQNSESRYEIENKAFSLSYKFSLKTHKNQHTNYIIAALNSTISF